jgi:hypothetical protein
MRTCPSVEGSASPLITHRIGVEVCMARQRTFFHKCHRCIYRGQPAAWEPEEAPAAMLNVHTAEEPVHADVRPLEIGPPERAVANAAAPGKNGKPAKAAKAAKKPARQPAQADAPAPLAAPVEAAL